MATWNRDDSDLTIATGIGSTTIGSNLTLSPNELDVASGDLTVDVAGDIILDAGGSDVKFQVGGTSYMTWSAAGQLKMMNAADVGDYFQIDVSPTHGSTVLSTNDNNINAAHLKLDIDGDIILDSASNKIELYDNGTLYGKLVNSSTNLQIKSGSSSTVALTFSGADATFAGTVTAGYLSLDNMSFNNNVIACSGAALNLDSSSTIVLDADDPNVIFKDAGSEWFRIKQDGTTRLKSNSAITIESSNFLYLNQDDDDKIKFNLSDDSVMESLQGSLQFSSTDEIILDANTDITLDANGGDVFLKDNAVTFGSLTNNSGNLRIKSGTTTALTLSGANATFAGNLLLAGNILIQPPVGDGSSEDFLVIDTGDDTIKKRTATQVRSDLGIADDEIIDWTTDQGSTNIHAGNYTDTNTTYSAGALLDLSTTTFNVDLTELTDGTADVVGSEDELVYLDDSVQKRKLISEIKLGQFNNDAGWTSNTGTISWDGSTANGVATYKDADEATVETNLKFDGTDLAIGGSGKLKLGGGAGTSLRQGDTDELHFEAGGVDLMAIVEDSTVTPQQSSKIFTGCPIYLKDIGGVSSNVTSGYGSLYVTSDELFYKNDSNVVHRLDTASKFFLNVGCYYATSIKKMATISTR